MSRERRLCSILWSSSEAGASVFSDRHCRGRQKTPDTNKGDPGLDWGFPLPSWRIPEGAAGEYHIRPPEQRSQPFWFNRDAVTDEGCELCNCHRFTILDDVTQKTSDPEHQCNDFKKHNTSDLNDPRDERLETKADSFHNSSGCIAICGNQKNLCMVLEKGLSNICSQLSLNSKSTFQLAKGVERCASNIEQLATKMFSCQEELQHTNNQMNQSLQDLLDLLQYSAPDDPGHSRSSSSMQELGRLSKDTRTGKRYHSDTLEDSLTDEGCGHWNLHKFTIPDDMMQKKDDPENQHNDFKKKNRSDLNDPEDERPETKPDSFLNSSSNNTTCGDPKNMCMVLEKGLANICSQLAMNSRSTFQLAKGVERCANNILQLATRMFSCHEELQHTNNQINQSLQDLLDLLQYSAPEDPGLIGSNSPKQEPVRLPEGTRTLKRFHSDTIDSQCAFCMKKSKTCN